MVLWHGMHPPRMRLQRGLTSGVATLQEQEVPDTGITATMLAIYCFRLHDVQDALGNM